MRKKNSLRSGYNPGMTKKTLCGDYLKARRINDTSSKQKQDRGVPDDLCPRPAKNRTEASPMTSALDLPESA